MTDDLIKWFWETLDSYAPNESVEDGICQCATEKLIEQSDNPNQMRSFLMASAFIDQMIYTHFREIYPSFRERFHFPKLYSHATIVGMASPGWLVYSRYGYDKKMDWGAASLVALQLFTECLEFLFFTNSNQNMASRFVEIAEKEILIEFEPEAAQKMLTILSGVDIEND